MELIDVIKVLLLITKLSVTVPWRESKCSMKVVMDYSFDIFELSSVKLGYPLSAFSTFMKSSTSSYPVVSG